MEATTGSGMSKSQIVEANLSGFNSKRPFYTTSYTKQSHDVKILNNYRELSNQRTLRCQDMVALFLT